MLATVRLQLGPARRDRRTELAASEQSPVYCGSQSQLLLLLARLRLSAVRRGLLLVQHQFI